jgi:tRNA A-37 threonylcarbamoyl transferase component Bud32
MNSFELPPGRLLAGKYEVISRLGSGWEGEVYKIREVNTDIECAAKLFFPQRNIRNKTATVYAKKLHVLRDCPIIIQYHTQDTITFQRQRVTVLISEFVEGELLSNHLAHLPGKRIHPFQAMHLLHALVVGMESVHHCREYHGDLHSENIIVRRVGLSYELKLLDLFNWGRRRREMMREDVCDMVHIFYEALGGQKHYAKQPKEVKEICCGLKKSLILGKFRNPSDLRLHLETQTWS